MSQPGLYRQRLSGSKPAFRHKDVRAAIIDKRRLRTLHLLQATTMFTPPARRRFTVHNPVKLSRQQFEQVQHALYSSFNRDELRMLVRSALGQELDAVTTDRDLSLQIFDVIIWAEKQGKVLDLLAAASGLRPDNSLLRQLQVDSGAWQEQPCDDVTIDDNLQAALSEPSHPKPAGNLYVGLAGPLLFIALLLALEFWIVRAAQTTLPGDAIYPLKQWIREQRLSLAPAGQLVETRAGPGTGLDEEAGMLAAMQQMRPDAQSELSIENTEPMVYHGRRGDLLMIGPFLVAPNYQPNAGVEDFTAMDINGALVPGSIVQLTYRVLPGNPNVVQGVRAVVVDGPKPVPTPTRAPTPTRERACVRSLPASWLPYPVRSGDTLAGLAYRTGVSVVDIMDVNCLETANLAGVSQIYLPERIHVRVTPAAMPVPPTPPPP